jgi:molybdopterin adenylyltransferase
LKTAAVLTISDTGYRGLRQDQSGPAVSQLLTEAGWTVLRTEIVPDEVEPIREKVRQLADVARLVIATGGTGLAPRDVTPEAVRPLLDKEIPGLGELMRGSAPDKNKNSALSRSLGGTIGVCLVLCLPGSPRGATESLTAVLPILPHAVEVLSGEAKHEETDN